MFATGDGILTQKDGVTPDGLQQVFATNLFGHFLLVSRCCRMFWLLNDKKNKTKVCFQPVSGFLQAACVSLMERSKADTESVCHLATVLIKN